jgi:Holliday junction resolvasome RuvABC ATP-dependent DNA helicase subunit
MAFESLVGQDKIKSKLNFYIEVFEKTNHVPFLSFIGARGLGKTAYAREFAKHLKSEGGEKKPFLEINSSTIKSAKQFFEQIFLPHIQDQEIVVLFDECHALPRDLVYAFLSILNTEKDHIREYNTADNTYIFNFQKHHFMFATTESQQLFPPMRDRLTTIEFSDYSIEDIKQIFSCNLSHLSFEDDALEMIAQTSRGNARSCILRSKEIKNYCDTYSVKNVTKDDVHKLFDILGVLPHGLNRIEWQILNILKKEGQCTLSMLAAKTGLSRSSLQREHELFLLRKGFITIDGLRKITLNGFKVLDNASKTP